MNDFLKEESERDPIKVIRESNRLAREAFKRADEEKVQREKLSKATPPLQMMGVGVVAHRLTRGEILARMAKDWEAVKKAMPDAPDSIRGEVFRALTYAPPDDEHTAVER